MLSDMLQPAKEILDYTQEMRFINWRAKHTKIVCRQDRHLRMRISKHYVYIKTNNPKSAYYLHIDMNGNPYIILWNWLSHVKKGRWLNCWENFLIWAYWLMSKILLTLTHFTQSYTTYNSADVPDYEWKIHTYLYNRTNKMLPSTRNISHNTG
jgi:hypothetical protein